VLRDQRDAIRHVGSVEYLEPLGVHSADSPAVAPAQSLTPEERQRAMNLVQTVVRRLQLVGTVTVQLAHGTAPNDIAVVSVTPYVTRTSLWCARVSGVPLVEWHTRLCGGTLLAELEPPSEPHGDELFAPRPPQEVCWCRLPLFPVRRLMQPHELLTTYAKSTGAVFGVGACWPTALQKAIDAAGQPPLGPGFSAPREVLAWSNDDLLVELGKPTPQRLWYMYYALTTGLSATDIAEITGCAPWFVEQLVELQRAAQRWETCIPKDLIAGADMQRDLLLEMKRLGSSDESLANSQHLEPSRLRAHRTRSHVRCGTHVLAQHATTVVSDRSALRLAYDIAPHPAFSNNRSRILLLGGSTSLLDGTTDYDYMLAYAIMELDAAGYSSILISPNAVHIAGVLNVALRHYIEAITPETLEDVFALERPAGVVMQFADRQSSAILGALRELRAPVLGSPLSSMERLLRRDRFQTLLQKLDIRQPSHGVALNAHDAYQVARDVGYPVIVHPARPVHLPRVAIWYDQADARAFLEQAVRVTEIYPLSVEKFLEAAHEFHVEAVTDGMNAHIAGVVEHVEEAGIHSADSAAVWPACMLPAEIVEEGRSIALRLARELNLRGTLGIKCALADDKVYLLDALPVTTRTTALLHTASGGALIPLITRILLGGTLSEDDMHERVGDFLAVRAPVFPFSHFPDSDAALGPENCAIGQSLGCDPLFGVAYAKALIGAGNKLPTKGTVLLSVADQDKPAITAIVRRLRALGFTILATRGTAAVLQQQGIPAQTVMKIHEGRPNVLDHIIDGNVQLIINTPGGKVNRRAEAQMRHEAVDRGILVITTSAGARAAVEGIEAFMRHGFAVQPRERLLQTLRKQRELPLDHQGMLSLA
jgi:carbamoyl-phosphate synthase large subunit